jgi:hypothetical protein
MESHTIPWFQTTNQLLTISLQTSLYYMFFLGYCGSKPWCPNTKIVKTKKVYGCCFGYIIFLSNMVLICFDPSSHHFFLGGSSSTYSPKNSIWRSKKSNWSPQDLSKHLTLPVVSSLGSSRKTGQTACSILFMIVEAVLRKDLSCSPTSSQRQMWGFYAVLKYFIMGKSLANG